MLKDIVCYSDAQALDGRKKRLGQYFTGRRLAVLLASLAGVDSRKTVIDTMSGSGDILAACRELGSSVDSLAGIEIDPIAHSKSINRIKGVKCIRGSAFELSSYKRLNQSCWNVVITNPPYVRYQSHSTNGFGDLSLPNGREIRTGLLEILDYLPHLDTLDKHYFKELVKSYSGLADLAVPSWILNSALVAEGGVMALVLPDSWLTRDYASVIQYILVRWFKVEFIVLDAQACWFPDAQVKTSLLIAKRVKRKASAFFAKDDEVFLKISLYKQLQSQTSLVKNFAGSEELAEINFSKKVRQLLFNHESYNKDGLEVDCISYSSMIDNVYSSCSREKWIENVENISLTERKPKNFLPYELGNWLNKYHSQRQFHLLSDLGVMVGQGLRTGANQFFYLDLVAKNQGTLELASSRLTGELQVYVKEDIVRPVLRKQAELPTGYSLFNAELSAYVLLIKDSALQEDLMGAGDLTRKLYKTLGESLTSYIRKSQHINFGTKGKVKKVYELSAVSPNYRKESSSNAKRFWYMLPNLTNRHTPDLFMARVNNLAPKTYLNVERSSVIDANFSSIWLSDDSSFNVYFLLSFLNSTWCKVMLEYSASIMGGGALKVEATHLRKLLVPELTNSVYTSLTNLGTQLANAKSEAKAQSVLNLIDVEIVKALIGNYNTDSALNELRSLATNAINRRRSQGR